MIKEKIDRINELARKSRNEGLNDSEKEEQSKLRREYIEAIKSNFRATLENIEIVDQKGDK